MQISPAAREYAADLAEPAVVRDALRLAGDNAVQLIDVRPTPGEVTATGVAYDGPTPAWFELALTTRGDAGGRCTCPFDAGMCAHLVAGSMVLLTRAAGATTGPSAKHTKIPTWKRELDAALPDPRPADAPELCLFVSVRQPRAHRPWHARNAPRRPYLAMRPGTRGSRGTWILGQRGWDLTTGLDPRHPAARAFDTLQTAAAEDAYDDPWRRSAEWLALDDAVTGQTWELLAALRNNGVPVLAGGKAHQPVVFDTEPIIVNATLVRNGSQLRLGAEVAHADSTLEPDALWWLGDPVRLAARVQDAGGPNEQVTLLRCDTPMPPVAARLLSRKAAMTITSRERDEFERDYLPRLQGEVSVRSPDGSYTVPTREPSTLVLTVAYDQPRIDLSWQWRRSVPGMAEHPHEDDVLTAVRAAAGSHVDVLFPDAASGSPTGRGTDGGAGAPGAPVGAGIPADRILGAGSSAVFVGEVLPALRGLSHVDIVETTALPAFTPAGAAPVIGVRSTQDGDWFDLDVTVRVGGEDVDMARLITALTVGDEVFVLPSGTYFPLDGPGLASLRAIVDEARALTDRPSKNLRVSRYQIDLWEDLSALGVAAEAEWWLAMHSLTADDRAQPVAPPAGLHASLRPYQQQGVAWLDFLRRHGLGGILADDMGLGKTMQTIAMMLLAHDDNPEAAPFIVVAPTSVVGNWAAECAKFAPSLRVATVTSTTARRGTTLADVASRADVVVTSYALFRLEADDYRALPWSGLIVDEAQTIKNPSSRGNRAARMLGAPFTLVLTGTPLENNLLELWTLATLAAPGLLGSKDQFTRFYRYPVEKEHDRDRLALLQRRLRPFLLRRTKELVASDLPPKQEQVLEVVLHPTHRRAYDVRFQRERQRVLGLIDDVRGNRFQIFRSLTLLRQLALDPSLVDAGDAPSAKLETLVDLLRDATDEGHRVLVLSQFTRFLTRARDRAASAGITSEYLDGSTVRRPTVISRFRDGDATAFFVSLKAGGVGLNLVEADYVVLLDPWWNPAVEEQAIDRTHRIGQARPVFVYRIVAADTIEQKVIALRESKARLFSRVLDGDGDLGSGALNADDIRALLE